MFLDDVVFKATRLIDKYPNAYRDFYGSGTPCIFKSGPGWYVRNGPEPQGIEREARPVYRHPIGRTWLSIGNHDLDSIGVKWTSIDPVADADAGEAKPFCFLIIFVGVKPHSLLYDPAVAAAVVVKQIFVDADFRAIEVAFVESKVTRSVATGPKLLSFHLLFDDVPELRNPLTPTLGLHCTPQVPHFEGIGALYFRLGKDDKRTTILTCAHVVHPSAIYANTGVMPKNTNEAREERTIDNLHQCIIVCRDVSWAT
ncbi:hypothetical protein M413DRAFT_166159 [Hebeloma cylindrosporum]|uniref:Uncharacterized protein n=1 Tax=Hebeloma cylindrosporum TaxID=76867 RepID=A0A0C3C8Z1_HEBCY|nr:hypothetical protein M413DRAFT_166159 [Hebeloma cylindrosporum h7]